MLHSGYLPRLFITIYLMSQFFRGGGTEKATKVIPTSSLGRSSAVKVVDGKGPPPAKAVKVVDTNVGKGASLQQRRAVKVVQNTARDGVCTSSTFCALEASSGARVLKVPAQLAHAGADIAVVIGAKPSSIAHVPEGPPVKVPMQVPVKVVSAGAGTSAVKALQPSSGTKVPSAVLVKVPSAVPVKVGV